MELISIARRAGVPMNNNKAREHIRHRTACPQSGADRYARH